ncbi:YARHG domain-containing protein [Lacrimispora sp.]|uniref:YARHG domain-containing protein n=1 Tax=Lacrimispora sp. TaxID=2719234 RepID=UPI003994D345
MRKKYLIFIVCICLIMTGCGKTNGGSLEKEETTQTEEIDSDTQGQVVNENSTTENTNTENESYEIYSGLWTEGDISHDMVISDGGSEFTVSITNKTELNGYLFSQQGTSERIAEIDNINGKIKDNECYYEFTDDGWGGKGTLHIQFLDDTIRIEVKNYKMDDNNLSGFGISGVYQLEKADKDVKKEEPASEMSEQDLHNAVYNRYYSQWPEDKMLAAIEERRPYRERCSFYEEVLEYMENVREVGDVANVVEPLYYSDMKYYKKQDFENVPLLIIHLAKNEIYAKHGYIFKNEDLNNYFKGQLWYEPSITPEDFDDSVFNDYEKLNLKLFNDLDKNYK